MRRLLPSLSALVLLAVPAAARDVFVDVLEPYTVTAENLAVPACRADAFDDPRLAELERAVCLFHLDVRSEEQEAEAVDLLQQAQVKGLPPVHQNFATLLSGLLSCSSADRHLERYRASGQQSLLERAMLCRARRMSAAELGSIRWDHAFFEYAPELGADDTLERRLEEMAACHAGSLDPAFDAECGLISNISETEIRLFVDEAVEPVIVKYFTGVESPVTAMFARKHQRAQGLRDSAAASIDELAAGAGKVNAAYGALNTVYEEARDEKIARIYDSYREAILKATSILDEFERWKGGLFITSENVNLMPKIEERVVEVDEELARVEGLAFVDKAERLTADVRRIVDSEVEDARTVLELCRIYFCELTNRRALARAIRACRRPSLAGNPLCIDQDETLRSGVLEVDFGGTQQIEVGDLCRSAGLEAGFAVTGMGPATAASCLAGMP